MKLFSDGWTDILRSNVAGHINEKKADRLDCVSK